MKVFAAALQTICSTLICVCAFESNASAQPASKAAIISTNSCKDVFGTRVALAYVANAENALLLNGSPVILLDADLINSQPIQVAEFRYFSQCAHHVLGHVLKAAGGSPLTPADAFDADCWSLRFLQRSSGYGASDTAIILAGIAARSVPGFPQARGLQRANTIEACR